MPKENECEHDWVFMETIRKELKEISYNRVTYKRMDLFYCKKCLEQKQIVKTEVGNLNNGESPDWYRPQKI